MLDKNLKSKINKLWDLFWSGGLTNPITAIEQMSYLIFMKRLEEEDDKKHREAEFTGEKYKSLFKGSEDPNRWSVWSKYPAGKILDHVRDEVFPFMRNLGGNGTTIYKEYMKDANFVIPTSSLLIEAVNLIEDMHIKEQNQDTQGDIYEFLLSELQTSGKNGQFRTPRHIIKMMVELTNPEIGDKILDPACGTAGFLVSSYEHILNQNKKEGVSRLTPKQKEILDNESLYGYDIDDTMVRISLMNLMMHGIKKPKIKRENTLSGNYEQENMYDVVLANPPFKGRLNKAEIHDRFRIKTTKTELLFLELMYLALEPYGGKCAVIVPEGVLFGSSKAHKQTRKMLLQKCRLDAVISMPSGVFKPYSGVSTAILFFTKGEPTEEVWFYKMESDGFSLDDKRNELDEEGDIPDILDKFKDAKKHKDRKKKYFSVPVKEIEERDFDLSLSKYQEIEYEEPDYEEPEVLKKRILKLEKEIVEGLEELSF